MALAFLPIYVAELGMEAYGLIGFFAALQAMLAVFDLGVTPTLTRESARYGAGANSAQELRDLIRTFEFFGCIGALLLASIMVAASERIALGWINAKTISPNVLIYAISTMGVVLAARLLEGVYRGVLLGLNRQVRYNLLNAGIATVRYAGAVGVLRFGSATVEAFFSWQVIMSLVSLVCLMLGAYGSLPCVTRSPRFSAATLRPVWRFSAGMTVIGTLSIAMANVDKFVLSHALNLEQFGWYALAAVAASTLYTLVVPVTQAFYPRMVAQSTHDDRRGLVGTLHLSSQLVAALVGVAAIFLCLFASEVLYIWSGNPALVADTAPILSVLSLAAFANCLGHIGVNVQLARGTTRGVATVNFLALLCSVFALPWVVKSHGAMGAAYTWLVITAFQAACVLMLAYRGPLSGEGRKWLIFDMLLPLTGAFLTAYVAHLCLPAGMSRFGLAFFLLFSSCGALVVSTLLAHDLRILFVALLAKRYKSLC